MSQDEPYVCDSCSASCDSAKELVKHYRENHPSQIERVTIPN